jgi:hypothetical protein
MAALLVFAAFDGIALLLLTWWLSNAPDGFEEGEGFHVFDPSPWQQLADRFRSDEARHGPAH